MLRRWNRMSSMSSALSSSSSSSVRYRQLTAFGLYLREAVLRCRQSGRSTPDSGRLLGRNGWRLRSVSGPDWFRNLRRMTTTHEVLLPDCFLDAIHLQLVPGSKKCGKLYTKSLPNVNQPPLKLRRLIWCRPKYHYICISLSLHIVIWRPITATPLHKKCKSIIPIS